MYSIPAQRYGCPSSLLSHFFTVSPIYQYPIMWKHDVIHKSSTNRKYEYIPYCTVIRGELSHRPKVTYTENFLKDGHVDLGICERRYKCKQTHSRNTSHPTRRRSKKENAQEHNQTSNALHSHYCHRQDCSNLDINVRAETAAWELQLLASDRLR